MSSEPPIDQQYRDSFTGDGVEPMARILRAIEDRLNGLAHQATTVTERAQHAVRYGGASLTVVAITFGGVLWLVSQALDTQNRLVTLEDGQSALVERADRIEVRLGGVEAGLEELKARTTDIVVLLDTLAGEVEQLGVDVDDLSRWLRAQDRSDVNNLTAPDDIRVAPFGPGEGRSRGWPECLHDPEGCLITGGDLPPLPENSGSPLPIRPDDG
ncbi:MAG: hypothetical protein ACFB3T_15305 [Geminicoccaceae bacterium]